MQKPHGTKRMPGTLNKITLPVQHILIRLPALQNAMGMNLETQ
jgi:hypothetical protein